MAFPRNNKRSNLGFTLIEVLTTTAILGVLASVAIPTFMDYLVVAKVTEGVLLLSELRKRVEVGFYETGVLDTVIPASPTPDGQLYGGPYYTYETLFGVTHEMWDQVEYQPKGPHRVLALRAHRLPEWDNSDIGLHLQIKLQADNTLAFRCTVNDQLTRMRFVPSTCREGNVNDWSSW
ncbi:MAG: pilin [Proteobacteria bacterium]|nr:pilin [Pseudomonadota bacterium]